MDKKIIDIVRMQPFDAASLLAFIEVEAGGSGYEEEH